jgi:hypothetical protein
LNDAADPTSAIAITAQIMTFGAFLITGMAFLIRFNPWRDM